MAENKERREQIRRITEQLENLPMEELDLLVASLRKHASPSELESPTTVGSERAEEETASEDVAPSSLTALRATEKDRVLSVGLTSPERTVFAEELGWMAIRHSSVMDNFACLNQYVARLLCYGQGWKNPCVDSEGLCSKLPTEQRLDPLSFYGVEAYQVVREAIKCFEMDRIGVACNFKAVLERAREGTLVVGETDPCCVPIDLNEEVRRLGRSVDLGQLIALWNGYLEEVLFLQETGDSTPSELTFEPVAEYAPPYLAHIKRTNLPEVPLKGGAGPEGERLRTPSEIIDSVPCYGIVREKLKCPPFIELLWSYFNEEGMLVQTLHAVSLRFQNKRAPGVRDPLAQLDLDPLRPLSNLLWGYIQDEQNRLTVSRRNFEYDHQYGIRLVGKAAGRAESVDSRSKFIEAFHFLLHRTAAFYREVDDETVREDPFPVLNALVEVHLLLAHGAHNQFGDLPWTARVEMRTQQWLLGRPEMREFLGGKPMVPYREPWMSRVDTVKALEGWTQVSISHFFNLALWGEILLLSIRYTNWSQINEAALAGNWAVYFRPEIQGYLHAYRAVTGVDLTVDHEPVDARMPSYHLQKRLAAQRT